MVLDQEVDTRGYRGMKLMTYGDLLHSSTMPKNRLSQKKNAEATSGLIMAKYDDDDDESTTM